MRSSWMQIMGVTMSLVSRTVLASTDSSAIDVDVIVIGAGVSGMATASALLRAGVSVKVLEAANFTGGRMHSFGFGDESVARIRLENGPNWICAVETGPDSHVGPNVNPLWRMAGEVQLDVVLDAGASATGQAYAGSVVITKDGRVVDVEGERRGVASAAWECANRTAVEEYHSGTDQSIADAMARCGWVPEGSIDEAIDWDVTVDPQGPGMSLRGALPVHTYMFWGADDYLVVDQGPRGFAKLIDHFSEDVLPPGDSRVVFDTMVETVSYGECGSVEVRTTDGRSFTARRVISTLPLGVLQYDHRRLFDPPLPARQAAALESGSMVMTNYTKIVAQWPTPWWEKKMGSSKLALVEAAPGGVKGDWPLLRNLNAFINGSNALMFDAFDPQSSRLEAMSDAEVQAEMLVRVRTLFPEEEIDPPLAFHMTRHGFDPLSRGAYTINNTHGEDFRQTLAPLKDACGAERVLWAGEATCDMLNGYAHGAYFSGLRVAAQSLHLDGLGPAPESICDRDRPTVDRTQFV